MARKNVGIESPDLKYRNQNMYWQSAELNRRAYNRYLDQFLQLAINRFKWINLPDGVDERFLEWTLVRESCAVMFPLPKIPDRVYATKVIGLGPLNVYDNPTKFRSVGNNGWNIPLDNNNAVLIWNSMTRIPMWSTLEYYAKRMADIDRTFDVNLKNQKTPFIITGPEEKQTEIKNYYTQIDSNEPAIFGLNSLNTDMNINVMNTNVPFLGIELQQVKRDLFNEVLEYLGIESSNTQKRERLIEAEIEANIESTEMMRLDGLNARRQAAEKFNNKFGYNIEVVWRKDLISDNYNFVNDLSDERGDNNG